MSSSFTALAPVIVLVAVLASDTWVYLDAKAQSQRGTPVILSLGSVHLRSPTDWTLACLVLWFLFFPLYVIARRREL